MMQNSMTMGAVQVKPAGIGLEEGLAALKCDVKRLLHTRSESFSLLCEESVTYGEVLMTLAGLVAVAAVVAVSGYFFGGEVM